MTGDGTPPATLTLMLPSGGRQVFTLAKSSVTLGRAMTSDIVLRDPGVSRSHARIERTPTGYDVVDLESANGLTVNGVPQSRATLLPGDVVVIGSSTLSFETGDRVDATVSTTASPDPGATIVMAAAAPVHLEDRDEPRVVVHTPAKTWEVSLANGHAAIGRDPAADVVIDHAAVSRRHAVIERTAGGFVLRDLNSRNGTWLGDRRVTQIAMRSGDSARIGPARVVLKAGDDDGLEIGEGATLTAETRRPVVIIPGFAGSSLWQGSERVWPTLRMHGLSEGLQFTRPLEARGIVDEVVVIPSLLHLDQYGVLIGYLEEQLGYQSGRYLFEFAYDFRQDNRESARRLAAAIDAWEIRAPITIVAHSMGCLIARYYVERLGGANRVERLILLGGPHGGSPYAFASLLNGPHLLPLGLMNSVMRDLIVTFPSWYQILPTYDCISCGTSRLDVLGDDRWVVDARRPLLRGARQFRRELYKQPVVPTVCVFGYGMKTITGASVERDDSGLLTGAEMIEGDAGDGTIPERSGIMRGAEIHPVRQHHGSLFVDNDVKMRLKLELTRPG